MTDSPDLLEAGSTSGPSARARAWLAPRERVLIGGAGIIGVLLLWQLAAELGLLSRLFWSSPLDIAAAGVREVQLPRFWNDVQASGFEFLVGYGGAALLGVPLGLVIGWSRTLNDVLDPWLTFFYSLPRIALMPVLILWLGIGIQSIIAVVFLGAFFSIMVNTVRGARVVDPRLLNVTRMYGASSWKVFSTVVVPSSIPLILVGLRLGVARALTGVVIGELFAAQAGLGRMIIFASSSLQVDRLLFAVIFLVAVGVLSVEIIRRFEVRFSTWRDDLATSG